MVVDLLKNATMKCGGCYIYSNLRGCDGQRVYFEGVSSITLNGQILNRARQFALDEVVIIFSVIVHEIFFVEVDSSRILVMNKVY